jgi:hypothetical protein
VIVGAGISVYTIGPFSSATNTTTLTTSTTSTTCSTTGTIPSDAVVGEFTAPYSDQVRVDYVYALLSNGSAKGSEVSFEVGYTNVGGPSIYVIRGCGSSLESSVLAGAGVVQTKYGARCLCIEAPLQVAPDQSAVATGPGCSDGYSYQLLGPGTFTVRLSLMWSGSMGGAQAGGMNVTATFDVE